MKNKFDKFLDALFGNKVKGRWIKFMVMAMLLLGTVFLSVWFILNVGYDNKSKSWYIIPPEKKIKVEYQK